MTRKKVLITGATGLIGGRLVNSLLKDDSYEIYLQGRHLANKWNSSRMHLVETDFGKDWSDSELPTSLDAIVHLCQSAHFRRFPEKARDIFYVNTLSTLKLINYAYEKKVEHFIYGSSGGVYGYDEEPFGEGVSVALRPDCGLYTTSKHCSEVILQSYFSLLTVVVLRFFFVYGEEQNADMLIPRLVRSVKGGEPISLHGTEGMKLNPIYVDDAVTAIIASLQLKKSDIINIGGPETLSLRQIGDLVGDAVGQVPLFQINETRGPMNLIGDISKMEKLLHSPRVKFSEGIEGLVRHE